jgi:hypothetical protein
MYATGHYICGDAMPTNNPRVQVTLTPALYAVLRRLSAATGNSMSALVAEFLQPNEAVFERMVTIIEAAATVRQDVRERIASNLVDVQTNIEGMLGLTHDLFERETADLLAEVETVGRRRRPRARSVSEDARASAAAAAPPSLTGGSGTPTKRGRLATKTASNARQVRRSGDHG